MNSAGNRTLTAQKCHAKRTGYGATTAVGVAHPALGRGGSEAATLWAIEALKDSYDVSLITAANVDLEGLNGRYGTRLGPSDFSVCRARVPAFFLRNGNAAALRGALYQRHCRAVAHRFDVLLSAYNPCDFGKPAIHRIADFAWDSEISAKYDSMPVETQRLIHRDNVLRKAYLGLSKALRRPSGRDLWAGEDIMIANSQWTAGIIRNKHPLATVEVVYPPVAGRFQPAPWARREAGFVCLGRLAHEKHVETIIEILSRVRALGHDVHLHIIGGRDHTSYGDMIERLCAEAGVWAVMEGERTGVEKESLLSRHRFALHACRREAFGIAVAEMAKAGCVTFVPDEGGPPEIVADARLCYRDVDDAVRKIASVLRSQALQAELHAKMLVRGALFSVEAYQDGIRRIVAMMLERNKAEAARS